MFIARVMVGWGWGGGRRVSKLINSPKILVILSKNSSSFKFTSGQYVSIDFNLFGTASSLRTTGRIHRVYVV